MSQEFCQKTKIEVIVDNIPWSARRQYMHRYYKTNTYNVYEAHHLCQSCYDIEVVIQSCQMNGSKTIILLQIQVTLRSSKFLYSSAVLYRYVLIYPASLAGQTILWMIT